MRVTRPLSALGILGAVLIIAACGGSDDESGEEDGLTIGYAASFQGAPTSQDFTAGLRCYAERNGGKVEITDANIDVNKQITDFNTLLAKNLDVLMVQAVDPRALGAPFRQAEERDVPVVDLFNPQTPAPGSLLENGIGYGKDAVEYILSERPRGNVAVVIEGPPVPILATRAKGFVDAARANDIEIAGTVTSKSASAEEGRQLGTQLLTKYPDANVLFSVDDVLAVGAALAAKERGATDLMTFGVGGTPQGIDAVKNGTLTVAYDVNAFGFGLKGAALGERLRDGQQVEPYVGPIQRYDSSSVDRWVPASKRCDA